MEKEAEDIQSMRRILATISGFEDEGVHEPGNVDGF